MFLVPENSILKLLAPSNVVLLASEKQNKKHFSGKKTQLFVEHCIIHYISDTFHLLLLPSFTNFHVIRCKYSLDK